VVEFKNRLLLRERIILIQDRTKKDHILGKPMESVLAGACALAVCFALILVKPWKPLVRFHSEQIQVTVDPERITVVGVYRLWNTMPFPVSQRFFYPTPSGGGLEPVDHLVLERLPLNPDEQGDILTPRTAGNEPYYHVIVPGRKMLEVRASYSQNHGGNHGRYILTTTGSWVRPLRRARFELELDSVDLIHSNYELSENKKGALTFQRVDFMPEEDWIFTFKHGGGTS
jgi:hypothetical protein